MSRYYYFGATLPGLVFGTKPPMSLREFLERCSIHLSEADCALLRAAESGTQADVASQSPLFRELLAWEGSLRNALVILRAGRLGRSGDRWLRPSKPSDEAARVAHAAFQAPTPLEGELELERGRWAFLDGHAPRSVFDLDALLAYGIKLKILERLSLLIPERGESGYREACAAILGAVGDNDMRGER